jgi:hypothetical protein
MSSLPLLHNRNELIRCVLDYVPEAKIRFLPNHKKKMDVYIDILDYSILLTPELSWHVIKRLIDNKIACTDCPLCGESELPVVKVICPGCVKHWCDICNMILRMKSKGMVICPFCQYSVKKKVYTKSDIIHDLTLSLEKYDLNTRKCIYKKISAYIELID